MQVRSKIDTLPEDVKEEVTRRLITGQYVSYERFSIELKERGYDVSEQALLRYNKRLRSKEAYQSLIKRLQDAQILDAAPDKLVSLVRSSMATLLAESDKLAKEMSNVNSLGKKVLITKTLTETVLMQLKCLQALEALQGGNKERKAKPSGKSPISMLLEAYGPEQ